MECGAAFNSAALPPIHNQYEAAFSLAFITTAAILPSGFRNAVDSSWLRLGELAILLAPG
jgi:hypothetical protein